MEPTLECEDEGDSGPDVPKSLDRGDHPDDT